MADANQCPRDWVLYNNAIRACGQNDTRMWSYDAWRIGVNNTSYSKYVEDC